MIDANADMEKISLANARLKMSLLRHCPGDGIFETGITGFFIARHDVPCVLQHRFDQPLASVIVQGSKRTIFENCEYQENANQILTICICMPSTTLQLEALPEKAFLSLFFHLNPKTLADLALELGWDVPHPRGHINGISVHDANPDFMECLVRLAELMDKTWQIPILAPMILRELHYHLLCGQQKEMLMPLYGGSAYGKKIIRAMDFLKSRLDMPVRIDELVKEVNMSEASLYRHFKILTGLSPLQYHKQLRLHEARRIILTENEQVSIAAMKVGYESVTQFNREYKNLFGMSPLQGIGRKNNK